MDRVRKCEFGEKLWSAFTLSPTRCWNCLFFSYRQISDEIRDILHLCLWIFCADFFVTFCISVCRYVFCDIVTLCDIVEMCSVKFCISVRGYVFCLHICPSIQPLPSFDHFNCRTRRPSPDNWACLLYWISSVFCLLLFTFFLFFIISIAWFSRKLYQILSVFSFFFFLLPLLGSRNSWVCLLF